MSSTSSRRRVLYSHTSALVGGGNKVMLTLFRNLDRTRFHPMSVLPAAGPMEQRLAELDVDYRIINLLPSHSRMTTVASTLKASALALTIRPAIVHANDPYTYRLLSLAGRMAGARRVCHVHHPNVGQETLAWTFQVTPDAIVTPSEYVKGMVEKHVDATLREKLANVSNPIDTTHFTPTNDISAVRARVRFDEREYHVLMAGAIARHKGHDTFLRMAARIRPRIPNCRFHIAGSALTGSEAFLDELKSLVRELELTNRVQFWGFVSDERLRDLMQAAHVFVLPTLEEGFGLVLVESQACGVPVVATNIQPLDEVVSHGKTGFLAPPRDAGAFADAVVKLLDNQGLRLQMGRDANSWAQSFGQAAFTARMQAVYESLS